MYSTYNESEHNILARPTKAKLSLLLSVSSVSLHALFQNNFCFKKKQKQKSGNLTPLIPSQKKSQDQIWDWFFSLGPMMMDLQTDRQIDCCDFFASQTRQSVCKSVLNKKESPKMHKMTIYHNILQHNIQHAISHFKKLIIETEIDEESQSKEQIVVQS